MKIVKAIAKGIREYPFGLVVLCMCLTFLYFDTRGILFLFEEFDKKMLAPNPEPPVIEIMLMAPAVLFWFIFFRGCLYSFVPMEKWYCYEDNDTNSD